MTTRTIEARCGEHAGNPYRSRCADCDDAQRELDEELRREATDGRG